jgi:DNA-directed RNA polymerase specialized sigma24 family protein
MDQKDLECWSINRLAERADHERHDGYYQGEVYWATYELFRRALTLHDEDAWSALYEHYYHMVASWLSRNAAIPHEEYDHLIDEMWIRLYRSINTTEKFDRFPRVPALLAYMKCCLGTAMVDYVREVRREQDKKLVELDQVESQEECGETHPDLLVDVYLEELLHVLWPLLRTKREQVLVQAHMLEGHTPREMAYLFPECFTDARAVYSARRDLRRRLMRVPAIARRWQGGKGS